MMLPEIVKLLKERTWEPDTEHELLLAFRKLDKLAHNGEEYGFIETEKMTNFLGKQGAAPFHKDEISRFVGFANDVGGSRM